MTVPVPTVPWIGDLALETIDPGTPVILIRNIDLNTGELFVFGSAVYEGEFERPRWYEGERDTCKRFKLDTTGQTVWDVETWWGRTERVQEIYAGFEWVEVRPVNRGGILRDSFAFATI